MSIIPNDHLYGSFEFATNVTKSKDGIYTAEAKGYKASDRDQGVALSQLNARLEQAIQQGDLVPDM